MLLRIGNAMPHERFAHLGPVTFEFFHLAMNYLGKVVFKHLYEDTRGSELGTMKTEKERILRHSVTDNMMEAYDANKDFFLSFFKCYVTEAALDFFGISSQNEAPTKNIPPTFENAESQREWVYQILGSFLDIYVFPAWSGHGADTVHLGNRVLTQFLEVRLADGSTARIPTRQVEEVHGELQQDDVKNYGHLVLELGMVFSYFLELIKTPERQRFLGIVKMMLTIMKANNSRAKYPLELLRMLVQQYSLLPLREACQVFQACFVNTRGFKDSHVPADLQMEWIVKSNKRHIKHMFANKTAQNIESKSAALPGISQISKNFDRGAGVVKRSKTHKAKEANEDEDTILEDLRKLRPFEHVPGRKYNSIGTIPSSILKQFNGNAFNIWFKKHKENFTS